MRGVIILLGIIFVTVFFCGVIPFVVMPNAGYGMALPVVSVPGEILEKDFLGISGFNLTNTLVGTLLADIMVLLFAFGATRNMQEIPGRLQGLFEVLTDALYGLAKSTAGENAKKIFPLMATVFLFLLIANWLELIPGVDSIGIMHCAEDGLSGYEKDGNFLTVNKPLYQGERATHENYEACHDAEEGHADHALGIAQDAVIAAAAAELGVDSIDWKEDVGNDESLARYVADNGGDPEAVYLVALVAAEEALLAEEGIAATADHTAEDATAEDEAEVDAEHEEADAVAEEADAEAGADDADADAAHDDGHGTRTPDEVLYEALYGNFYRDDIYIVTPFVRAAATDLNLTLGLGLFAFIAIQVFGVQALGVSYFTKFFNTPALGKLDKNPMGAMDFVVGLLEIISELAKVLSFGFRLFGNIFAGQVLLFVMTFLVAWILPAIFYGLELFVGLIQAFVFSMLLLVFSSMAMQGHGHGDEQH
ncbi:MAG: F0F1 ATP synthase subunit A [Anaerolineae bacterium]|nr:F0F1 ATP synthase subunit A [Anaerolineae bacterium]